VTLSIYEVIESSTLSLKLLSCSHLNGTLSAKLFSPQHAITIKAVLNDIQLVGRVKISLYGPSQENGLYS
jgi:hypothetical protein